MIFLFFNLSFVFSSLCPSSSPLFSFLLSFSFSLFLSFFSDNGTHSEKEFQHLSETFHLVLSCLVLSSLSSSLLSLSSFSVFFLCLCLRVLVVCVSLCVVVCVCVELCGVLLCVWCVVWHAENPVCRLKTPPCVHSQHARGAGTHGRFECTHGSVCESTHGWSSPILLTKKSPRRVLTWPHGSLKKPLNLAYLHVPDSSNHSLHLTKLLGSSYPQKHWREPGVKMVRFIFRSDLC